MSLFSAPDCTTVKLGKGDAFSYIGGHVTVDPTRGRLLSEILPVWIHSRAAAPETATFRWLIDRLVVEKDTALHGSQLASAQLTQLLFIQILRSHLNSSSHMPPGWLRALADPRVAPALRLMHGHPDRAWHLEELARSCAMSRTSFALHFRNVAGVAPLTYLAEWRSKRCPVAWLHIRKCVQQCLQAYHRHLADGLPYIAECAWDAGHLK